MYSWPFRRKVRLVRARRCAPRPPSDVSPFGSVIHGRRRARRYGGSSARSCSSRSPTPCGSTRRMATPASTQVCAQWHPFSSHAPAMPLFDERDCRLYRYNSRHRPRGPLHSCHAFTGHGTHSQPVTGRTLSASSKAGYGAALSGSAYRLDDVWRPRSPHHPCHHLSGTPPPPPLRANLHTPLSP